MLELHEALARILETIPVAPSEQIPVGEACGRFLTERIHSPLDLPGFDNSAMDGYAVRSVDVTTAGPTSAVRLRIEGRLPAGVVFKGQLSAGCCVRVFTGSPLPRGADSVVMQEDTRVEGSSEWEVQILDAVKPWENVRLRGEDIKSGALLIETGECLKAGAIGLLAAVGLAQVNVGVSPVVGLIATGSELKEVGEELRPGQIYESNRSGLAALARKAGANPRIFPLVPDRPEETRVALKSALEQCDAVVTSGGVSVGELDLVKSAFEDIGGQLEFWRVAIRPGRPFVYGRWRGKLLFGLPGNPVSAFVTFLLLVYPALLRYQGAKRCSLPFCTGILAEPLSNRGDRRHFMRVKMDPLGKVYSAGVQASHFLSSLAAADGLVDVPPQTTLNEGSLAQVMLY